MAHDHSHQHDSNSHDSQRRLFWGILLTAGFMLAEVVGGILSGSLALLADAGHMLTDAAALGLAWFAAWISRRPADSRRSYGYHRVQTLAAFVNGLTLIAIVVWIGIEAVRRFMSPVAVMGVPMLVIATLGLVVNLLVFAILHGGDRDNLNIRGAALHVLGDLLGSVAAIIAALVILATGWTPIDPLLSLLVAALILKSAWKLTRESGHILLEGAPQEPTGEQLRREIPAALPAVHDVHHVHLWSLTPARHLASLHAAVDGGEDRQAVLIEIRTLLMERYGIYHATIQLEDRHDCADTRE
ncbi:MULTISPECIES: cation diffusion facilitator family transporter [unclassified Halomonas]|uniref:cation diffusion facilitator family transporter n=1 Tax=unclassified Halomonas TaxID=2609666 RepID=UPI002888057B|nr:MULTISPECIES: cation diffusion facilitator family transporter [unclassified Halomonas]MDT0501072.1 cation diffusion facilitator family transporter [Halomonas sp. PAR7]MDT0513263.1 cation diffusion facilitator family transporter [Halomonas sp. LES1]MDT0592224.1 cation diffusion facilitator family transporter [Halomonas sp. PAR8]